MILKVVTATIDSAAILKKTKTKINAMNIKTAHQTQWFHLNAWLRPLAGIALFAGTASCAFADDKRAPDVPPQISVGETNKVHFHGFGVGFQIYTWNGTSWGTAVPEATLFDEDGNVVALHFGVFAANGSFIGPAWQSNSGSEVVGKLPPAAVVVDTNSIPWLRLAAVKELTHGPGIFADTSFIQRVNTTGGKAPSTNGAFVGQVARKPYTADYFFYRQTND
jgi:hypothetical protein